MCGRFTLRAPASAVAEQFSLFDVAPFAPRFNIAPTQPVAVVRAPTLYNAGTGDTSDGRLGGQSDASPSPAPCPARELVWLRWGLVPSWAKDPAIGARMINARAETAAQKPAFRAALRRRRCLVVADGFYEWQKTGARKQPYFIHMKDDRPFAFAGLWESWTSPDGAELPTCTLLTTQPNELTRPIHDRMPVVLSAADYALWLDPSVQDAARVECLLHPYPAGEMEAYPVSTRVNSPAHDGPDCLAVTVGQVFNLPELP